MDTLTNSPFASFYNEINGTRQYIIDENNLTWLLNVAEDMMTLDLSAFKGQPMQEAVLLNISRIQNTFDMIHEEKND